MLGEDGTKHLTEKVGESIIVSCYCTVLTFFKAMKRGWYPEHATVWIRFYVKTKEEDEKEKWEYGLQIHTERETEWSGSLLLMYCMFAPITLGYQCNSQLPWLQQSLYRWIHSRTTGGQSQRDQLGGTCCIVTVLTGIYFS